MLISNVTAQLNTEKAVGEILSNFNSHFVMDVMQDSLKNKFRPYSIDGINYPNMLERDFTATLVANPSFQDQVNDVRCETYLEIIRMICDHYNLQFLEERVDHNPEQLYTVASILYDVFVSSFTSRMVHFYVQFIIRNLDYIYNQLHITDESKKKDIGSYSKRMYVDPKLVAVHSYMDQVLNIITAVDIPLPTLLGYLCADINTSAFLSTILVDKNDIYKYHYASYVMDPYTRPDMFTVINLNLQAAAAQRAVEVPTTIQTEEPHNA